MKQATRLFAGALLSAFTCFGMVGMVSAQDKGKDAKAAPAAKAQAAKSTRKVLAENDKMIVFEITQKPGEVNTPSTATTRAVRALQGGTTLRTFADGKTETKEWKTGEVEIQVPGPAYTTKNVGKTDFVVYVVALKEAPQAAPAKK